VVMRIEPLDATLGAVVTDVRLADLDDDTWTEVEAAFHEHAVLVFPDQHLTKDEQLAFATRFGPLEDLGYGPGNTPIANTTREGGVRPADDPVLTILRGNEGWHTDSSYMPLAAKASMLSAHVVPSRGGRTEWADMRAAYEALDDATKARIAPLSAHHSYIYSQEKMGEKVVVGSRYGFHDGPAPLRPLVKMHPVTRRPSLFLGRHAYGIPGLSDEESESLLAIAEREEAAQAKTNPELREVLFAPDRDSILDWLRTRPLLHIDRALDFAMVHAGFAPGWTLDRAERAAREVEQRLAGDGAKRLLLAMFGNKPDQWSPKLRGIERLRATINVMTRMRYCDVRGRIAYAEKGAPGTQKPGLYPWFEVPGRVRNDLRIICGHWSTLGRFQGMGIYAIDGGCVWGGELIALRLDDEEPQFFAIKSKRPKPTGKDGD